MPTKAAPPHQRHVAVHTADATGRLLRALTDTLRSAKVEHATPLLSSLSRLAGLSSAHPTHINEHLTVLCDLVDTPCARTRALALRATLHALRALPTRLIAPHLLPLARALSSAARARAPAPTALLALAGVVAAAASLRAHSADALSAAVVDLALARIAEPHPDTLRPMLCIALASVATAPSLVRVRIPALTAACRAAFHTDCARTRTTAVTLLARLVLARSPKGRSTALSELLTSTCVELEQINVIFERYTTRAPQTTPDIDTVLHDLSEQQLMYRFTALCDLLPAALVQPTAISGKVPVTRLVTVLLNSLRITNIDPIAAPAAPPKLEPEYILAVLPAIHDAALKTLPALFLTIGKGNALPCASIVTSAFSDALLDVCTDTNAPIPTALAGIRARTALYAATAALAHATSAAAALPLARALVVALDADVALLARLHNARKRDLQAAVGAGRTDGSSLGGNSRKRRRTRGAAVEAAAAISVGAEGPAGSVGEDALVATIDAVSAGMRAAGALLGAGALADKSQCNALRALERVLSAALILPNVRSQALAALSKALLSAGSGATRARSCMLLPQALLAADRVAQVTPGENSALATAAIDALLHPRAPPVVRVAAAASRGGSAPAPALRQSNQLSTALQQRGWNTVSKSAAMGATQNAPSVERQPAEQSFASGMVVEPSAGDDGGYVKRVRFSDDVVQSDKPLVVSGTEDMVTQDASTGSNAVPRDATMDNARVAQDPTTDSTAKAQTPTSQPESGEPQDETTVQDELPSAPVSGAGDVHMETVSVAPEKEAAEAQGEPGSTAADEKETNVGKQVEVVEKKNADMDEGEDEVDEDAVLQSLIFEGSDKE